MGSKLVSMEKIRTMKLLEAVHPEIADLLLTLEPEMIALVEKVNDLEAKLAEADLQIGKLAWSNAMKVEKISKLREKLAEAQATMQQVLDKLDRDGMKPGWGVVRDWLREAINAASAKEESK